MKHELGSSRLYPLYVNLPVADYHAVELPLFTQYVVQQPPVLRSMHAVNATVTESDHSASYTP